MRGVYTMVFRIAANTAAKTLWYATAPSNIAIDVLSVKVTDESNETNEQLACLLQRVTSLGTPTATTVTPSKHERGDQAAAGTYKANVTASEPTYGAVAQDAAIVDAYGAGGFPSLSGHHDLPTPEERVTIQGGETYGLRLLNAMTAADLLICITVQERG